MASTADTARLAALLVELGLVVDRLADRVAALERAVAALAAGRRR